jgi:riboflavin synthase
MFTGIIEELGEITSIKSSANGGKITICAGKIAEGTKIGDSISVNGVCLTATDIHKNLITMDILRETLDKTTLRVSSVGEKVNLECSLQPTSRFGGHFVFGHVDCRGKVEEAQRQGQDWLFRICVEENLMTLIAPKGSIAVDGISLTVAEIKKSSFTVYIIPHTYGTTTLQFRKRGAEVNIEADMLARYVLRSLTTLKEKGVALNENFLREHGFI